MNTPQNREFARLKARLEARIRVLGPEDASALEERLRDAPSVWALGSETALENLAASPSAGSEALLAESILELANRIGRFRNRESDPGGPMEVATVTQLSGGGALLETPQQLRPGTRLELRLIDDDSGVPPVRVLAEVVHSTPAANPTAGVRFEAVHPRDRERLIRYLYQLQRRELRRTHGPEADTA